MLALAGVDYWPHAHPQVPTDWSWAEFLRRFSLSPPSSLSRPGPGQTSTHEPLSSPLKPAAVLIPIIVRGNDVSVLLTRRSHQLRHHPGQICFPGGRRDEEDESLAATALRETHEELGIPAACIQLLGQLPEHITVSHYRVVPYLGLLQADHPLHPARDEVAEAFELPLWPLLDASRYGCWLTQRNQQPHRVYGITVHHRLIWGATARILWQLAHQVAR